VSTVRVGRSACTLSRKDWRRQRTLHRHPFPMRPLHRTRNERGLAARRRAVVSEDIDHRCRCAVGVDEKMQFSTRGSPLTIISKQNSVRCRLVTTWVDRSDEVEYRRRAGDHPERLCVLRRRSFQVGCFDRHGVNLLGTQRGMLKERRDGHRPAAAEGHPRHRAVDDIALPEYSCRPTVTALKVTG
jgi:hypothetical protein